MALTLKTLGGFGVPEIARAFLSSEATIAQRLVRAKRRLREEAAPLVAPDAADLPARLPAALDALYLLFNEGYSAHQGEDLVRHELCGEAIRLTSLLARHPAGDRPAVHALLALMLLQAARLPARTDAAGDLLLLAEQDRGRWDRRMIAAGLGELARAATGAELTEYHLQAGIAACHATAPAYEATDWGASWRITMIWRRTAPRRLSRSTGRWRWPWRAGPRRASRRSRVSGRCRA